MSPHAISPTMDGQSYDWSARDAVESGHSNGDMNGYSNGHSNGDGNGHSTAQRSNIARYDDDEVHDLLCVGFGPASLAIAVALHDALEDGKPALRTTQPKVRFLERQPEFAWHAGMLLPGTKMQITFLKDLATMRNPRSHFTFVNYLHTKGRLIQFSNLDTFLPQRIEYQDYMKWCAGFFENVVDYSQTVESVTAGHIDPSTGAIESFAVTSKNHLTGHETTLRARHVVIAAGGKPNIPSCLPAQHPQVIHSSQYATSITKLYPSGHNSQPRSVVVIGAGQSAAEVFSNICSRFPDAKTRLLIRGAALRPSDDSPFVNEIFDPARVDDVYHQTPEIRLKELARDRGTNYAVVRPELLEHLYHMLYTNRILYGDADEDSWPHRILPHREILGTTPCVQIDGKPALQLHIANHSSEYRARPEPVEEILTADLVVVASGYRRDTHEEMLKGLQPEGGEGRWQVRRDYGVEFEEGRVGKDAGVWLQGCNEKTHGLSDSLLSILAHRGGEMVESIFGAGKGKKA